MYQNNKCTSDIFMKQDTVIHISIEQNFNFFQESYKRLQDDLLKVGGEDLQNKFLTIIAKLQNGCQILIADDKKCRELPNNQCHYKKTFELRLQDRTKATTGDYLDNFFAKLFKLINFEQIEMRVNLSSFLMHHRLENQCGIYIKRTPESVKCFLENDKLTHYSRIVEIHQQLINECSLFILQWTLSEFQVQPLTYFSRIDEEMGQIRYREHLRNSIYSTERDQASQMTLSQFSKMYVDLQEFQASLLREKSLTQSQLKNYLTKLAIYKVQYPERVEQMNDMMFLETGIMRNQILCKLQQMGKYRLSPDMLNQVELFCGAGQSGELLISSEIFGTFF